MKPVQSCDVFSHHHHDKLEVWPSASTQFAMQGLKIAIQQQCTWGYTRGGVWPLKSQNITNPRRTFWYRPSSAPFYKKKKAGGLIPVNLHCPALSALSSREAGARAAARVRVGGVGNAAQRVRYVDLSAVISGQFYLQDSPTNRGLFWIFFFFFALTAGPLCAFNGEERQLSDIRLLFKVSVEERLFSHCMNASCGIFMIQWQTGSCSHIQ